jgi:hypothetical protein
MKVPAAPGSRVTARDLRAAKTRAAQVRLLDPSTLTAADLDILRAEMRLLKTARQQRLQCTAPTRSGTRCKMRAEPAQRVCRRHGGRSTGPTTAEGKARIGELARARMLARWAVRREEKRDDQQGG